MTSTKTLTNTGTRGSSVSHVKCRKLRVTVTLCAAVPSKENIHGDG